MQDLTFINFQGLTLLEPMNFATDVLVAIACYIYTYKLWIENPSSKQSFLYRLFFIMIGSASLFGGFTHLFANYLTGLSARAATWSLLGIAVFSMEYATIITHFKKRKQRLFLPIFSLQLLIFLSALLFIHDFRIVIINMILGLLMFTVPVELSSFFKKKSAGSLLIALGITATLSAAIIHIFHLSPHKWFNHNDVAHVVTAFTLMVIYKGSSERLSLQAQPQAEKAL